MTSRLLSARAHSVPAPRRSRAKLVIRTGTPADSGQIHELIMAHLEEGHLLPRTLAELECHVTRFVVASRGRTIVACGELAPLSHDVAEIRSLVVADRARSSGVGAHIVEELRRRARVEDFERLCAFTHSPEYFVRLGFSIVPHTWLPEKIAIDCSSCVLFRHCGQFAMVLPLEPVAESRHDRLPLHA